MKIIQTQRTSYDCGIACISHVLQKRGVDADYKRLCKLGKLSRKDGMSVENVSQVFTALGIKNRFRGGCDYRILQNCLKKGDVIIDWLCDANKDSGHFSVLENIDSKYVTINDPYYMGSIRTFRWSEFEPRFYDYENGKKINRYAIIIPNGR